MSKPVLAGIAIVAVVLGIMVYSSLNLASHRVEVCIQFKGQNVCKIASAVSEQDAIRAAITNACGELAAGVTETLACGRVEPTRLTVLK